jgi:hypothetical protein
MAREGICKNTLHQKAIVHWVDDKKIGAAFCDLRAYEGKLGFYFRPA